MRATSAQITALAKQRGIEIEGKKPQSTVASILSHSPDFDNTGDIRGRGYGLKEWSERLGKGIGGVTSAPSVVRPANTLWTMSSVELVRALQTPIEKEQTADPEVESAA